MEGSASDPQRSQVGEPLGVLKEVSKLWWLWLVFGVVWVVISVVILQFDDASITTTGVLIGAMFIGSALQNFTIASLAESGRWLYGIFGVLFLIAGILSLISPGQTLAAFADVLGFLFLIVGVFWIIEAFLTRELNDLWWFGLLGGILMIILAFWTAGQFFIEKVYVLLAFAGIWALMQGVTDFIRAFQIRGLRELTPPRPPQ